MTAHDITDPNAPLGWQCGDPSCRKHGIGQFSHRSPTHDTPEAPKSVAGMEWPARCSNCGLLTEDPDAYGGDDEELMPDGTLCRTGTFHRWAPAHDTPGAVSQRCVRCSHADVDHVSDDGSCVAPDCWCSGLTHDTPEAALAAALISQFSIHAVPYVLAETLAAAILAAMPDWVLVPRVAEDMTTAYMVGYENGKEFAILHARLVHGCDHGAVANVATEYVREVLAGEVVKRAIVRRVGWNAYDDIRAALAPGQP